MGPHLMYGMYGTGILFTHEWLIFVGRVNGGKNYCTWILWVMTRNDGPQYGGLKMSETTYAYHWALKKPISKDQSSGTVFGRLLGCPWKLVTG